MVRVHARARALLTIGMGTAILLPLGCSPHAGALDGATPAVDSGRDLDHPDATTADAHDDHTLADDDAIDAARDGADASPHVTDATLDIGPPRCGDGVPQDGENEESCCVDVGCSSGACDSITMTCVDPWRLTCASVDDACAVQQPWLCDDQPPSYACGACGCPAGQTCHLDFCYADGVPELERFATSMPLDLPLDDYFALIDHLTTAPALSYAELVSEFDQLLREDARRTALLFGESHGSSDEQSVAVAMLHALDATGWPLARIGIEDTGSETPVLDPALFADLNLPHTVITGGLTNDAYCAWLTTTVGSALNHQQLFAQYSGSGHTSHEICRHPQHWPICALPHSAECLASSGRKALTVIAFDPDIWLTATDAVMMRRLGDRWPVVADVNALLDAQIARWETTMARAVLDPAYDVELAGNPTNVRCVPPAHTPDVFFAFFPRPGRAPYIQYTYRAAFNHPAVQLFLLEHDLGPGRCGISWDLTPGAETFYLYCHADGHAATVTVEGQGYTVVDYLLESP